MKTYHKIQSIYKRDPENRYKTFLDGDWSVPAFDLLKDLEWTFTEKIDGMDLVRSQPTSVVAEDTTLMAEGIVARPRVELRDRMGRRIITKIKVKDFAAA